MKLRHAVQAHNRNMHGSNAPRTENGAETNASSGNALLDFFFKAAAARKMDENTLTSMFDAAYQKDRRLAMQTLAWLRDVRGGAGERRAFRTILTHAAVSRMVDSQDVQNMIRATAEFGRFDDLFSVFGTEYEPYAIGVILEALNDPQRQGLVAKWMPRKGPIASRLARAFGATPRQWRKTVVSRSKTVEQDMCANRWEGIDYNKVPSVASARYRKAFNRHDPYGYQRWIDGLNRGTSKVNASAIFPHDVIKGLIDTFSDFPRITEAERSVIEAQWKALPNYMGNSSILPIVDVSGSMQIPVSGETRAIDISVGLGLYLAERNPGAFSNLMMTFSNRPQFHEIQGRDIVEKIGNLPWRDWAMNTDLQASLELLLRVAQQNRVAPSDMPGTLLILSDMEFDSCARGTNLDGIRYQFMDAGYEVPNVVFWNLNSRQRNNVPVRVHDTGTALVSGYSPSILKGILGDRVDPESVFLDTVDVPRYRIFG